MKDSMVPVMVYSDMHTARCTHEGICTDSRTDGYTRREVERDEDTKSMIQLHRLLKKGKWRETRPDKHTDEKPME